MDVKLVVAKGNCHPRHLSLRGPKTVIGRQRGSTLRIPSPDVSRQHCLLQIADGQLTVEDLNSSNGTFLNGERVMSPEIVRPGDHLQIGPLTFIVEYDQAEPQEDALALGSEPDLSPLFQVDEEPAPAPVQERREPAPAPAPTTTKSPRWKDDADAPIPLTGDDEDVDDPSGSDKRETSLAGENWHLPDGADLRNLLAKMDGTGSENDQ